MAENTEISETEMKVGMLYDHLEDCDTLKRLLRIAIEVDDQTEEND